VSNLTRMKYSLVPTVGRLEDMTLVGSQPWHRYAPCPCETFVRENI
jgi:hypothetical protein